MTPDELIYYVALQHVHGCTCGVINTIIERVGSLKAFFDNPRSLTARVVRSDLDDALRYAEKTLSDSDAHGISVMTYRDSEYPTRLLACEDAPVVLFTKGKINLNALHVISIVGTRNATEYGKHVTADIVSQIAALTTDTLVVSGLAYGIDAASHIAALSSGLHTAAVLGTGLDHIYPADNTELAREMLRSGLGMLITEYPYNYPTGKRNFLERNRIVAGLSDCVLVVESGYKGGSLSTARLAFAYNRNVYAVPGRLYDRASEGCNMLIASQKANIVTSPHSLIDDMHWRSRPDSAGTATAEAPKIPMLDLTDDESAVISAVSRLEFADANTIAADTRIAAWKLSPLLVAMEMKGLIARTGSNYILRSN